MPWHVPFHRVEAAAAAAGARGGEPLLQQHGCPLAELSVQSAHPSAAATGALANDESAACMLHSQEREAGHEASESSNAPEPAADGDPTKADKSVVDSVCANARAPIGNAFPDGRVDSVKGTVVFKRYYHLFDQGELDSLVHGIPGVRLTASFFDKSNWCVIFQKL